MLLATLTLSGCVTHERFRYVQKQDECFAPAADPVPGVPDERRLFRSLDCRTSFYKVGFVEFEEDGDLVDPDQARKVLRLIQAEKGRFAGGKIITLVYVHGWKNNSDQAAPGRKDKDVERFSLALSELGYRARLASPATPVPIVGVYIGWKGKSLKGPGFFNWLSYWGRRNTANHVGGKTLTSVLNDVIEATTPDDNDPSRVLFVGHSFGARVLEHAVQNGVSLYDAAKLRAAGPVRPRVDLVLYVNAANDARLGLGRILELQKDGLEVRHPDYDAKECPPGPDAAKPPGPGPLKAECESYPLIVAITSRGDLATKYVQPIANRINLDETGAQLPQLPAGQYADSMPSEGRLKRSAPGHLRFMHSHDVTEVSCPSAATSPPACSPVDASCAFAFRTRGAADACFKASVRGSAQGGMPFNRTAYWIMDVDPRVVKDHGDIWNLSMLNMLAALIAPRGFFDPAQPPMQLVVPR
jgi:hypothetical protein